MSEQHESKHENIRQTLQLLSTEDFLNVGMHQMAYICPLADGTYAVHAANGSKIALQHSYSAAQIHIRQKNMQPVTLH